MEPRGPVVVFSRPEPWFRRRSIRRSECEVAENTMSYDTYSWRIPNPTNRQKWWVDSLRDYPHLDSELDGVGALLWNPFVALSSSWDSLSRPPRPILFDLLDDWTRHYAFKAVAGEVDSAYRVLFERADVVTANSEETAALAVRFGRSDVHLVLNGCEPSRFAQVSRASGALTIGYVGKIGRRLDLDLICATVEGVPDVRFVFAGPILDAEYRKPLRRLANLDLLGDVHYRDVPALLESFDVGWVPHRVGDGEVGGDVIKTYEYRAAGLPVLTTPVLGARSRPLDRGVIVLDAARHSKWLIDKAASGARVKRIPSTIPPEVRWSFKAQYLLDLLEPRVGVS